MNDEIAGNEPRHVRRGYCPSDEQQFTGESRLRLESGAEDIIYLLDRGYSMDSAISFVGNHRRLTARQRLALMRLSASTQQIEGRSARCLPSVALQESDVYIDGFNIIITLETALSHSLLLSGRDRVVRDLAGVRGTYRIIDVTESAIRLLFSFLASLSVRKATILLDAPVSNSGRLSWLLEQLAGMYPLQVDSMAVPDADRILGKQECVMTGDSVILDRCSHWYNLVRNMLPLLGDYWLFDL
ncbi:MAG: DUF434 domain-containing protein [Spirochaetia bacterium]|jgi:hypothetical protein|nr:DUF434 domain-containing protein [Spirochaetia bacterium]